jgi:hypothetical protein
VIGQSGAYDYRCVLVLCPLCTYRESLHSLMINVS